MAQFQQTVYTDSFPGAYGGQISDSNPARRTSRLNKSGGTLIAGLGLVNGSTLDTVTLPSDGTHPLAGVNILQFATDPNLIAGTANYREGVQMPILEEGSIWVVCDQTMAVGDPVFVRYSDSGSDGPVGCFRKDADSSHAREVYGARVLTASGTVSSTKTATTGVVEIYLDVQLDAAFILGIANTPW